MGPLRSDEISLILAWRYEEPYDVYDALPAAAPQIRFEMSRHGSEFLAVRDSTGLLGFCSFGTDGRVAGGTYDDSVVDVGAGMDPARVGSGLGHRFLQAIVDHGFGQLNHKELRATVASWNQRALRVAQTVGFVPESTFQGPGGLSFTVLLLSRTKPLT